MRAQKIIDEATLEYEDGLREYDESVAEFEKEISEAEADINNAFDEIQTGESELNSAETELKNTISQLDLVIASGAAPPAILTQKSNLQAQLNEVYTKREELEATKAELILSQDELALAKEEIDELKPGEWTILDRDMHYSMATYSDTVTQMQVIGLVFPVFFFLVSALVCLTTMTRMVDEQRGRRGYYQTSRNFA